MGVLQLSKLTEKSAALSTSFPSTVIFREYLKILLLIFEIYVKLFIPRASFLTLSSRKTTNNRCSRGSLRILKKPVLLDGRGAGYRLKVVVEPDLVSEDGVVEVEVVGGESVSINEDDASSLADRGRRDAMDGRTRSRCLS